MQAAVPDRQRTFLLIEHLTKIFRSGGPTGVRAVNDLSLSVEKGELLVLLGPSGCGKTTTLRLIAGLEQPSEGTISIEGKDVIQVPAKDRDVAMVFQHHALYPHMTVEENLGFGLKLRRRARLEIESKVRNMASLLEISNCLSRKPAELSGGQRQRVALGRALVRQPKVLLLDEPLSNLDTQLRAQLRTLIAEVQRALGCTMIYVTHEQTEAMMLGTRLAVMNEGALQQVGKPLEIYRRPRNLFVARFLGWPPINLFHGIIVRKADGFYFEQRVKEAGAEGFRFQVELPAVQEPESGNARGVVLGLRPEDLRNGNASQLASIEGTVRAVESAGPETYLRVGRGDGNFVARVSADESAQINEKRVFSFDPHAAHLFDEVTGKRICCSSEDDS